MNASARQKILQIITDIKMLHPKLQFLTDTLKGKLSTFTTIKMEERGADYWRTQALSDALIRVRIFVENNLSYIETLGVLSLCRYTFELVVWLKHMEMDHRFALIYARMLIKQQTQLYDDLVKHLRREIDLYNSLAEEEKTAHTSVLGAAAAAGQSADPTAIGRRISEDMHAASDHIDEKLALQFAIYSSEIKHNGYGFQAHLIETQALPQALDYFEKNDESLTKFNNQWAATISELKLKEWKWNARAAHVDMASEYDFIYSYTSRLLHATPASLTTDQKSLEDEEAFLLLRYVCTQFRWIIQHAEARVVQQTIH